MATLEWVGAHHKFNDLHRSQGTRLYHVKLHFERENHKEIHKKWYLIWGTMNKLTLLYPEFWFREIFHRFLYSGLHCCHFIQNLPWSYVALPLLYIQSHALSKKQTYLLPFSLWLQQQPHSLSLLFPGQPSTLLPLFFFNAIS